jgi:hypothetical protein
MRNKKLWHDSELSPSEKRALRYRLDAAYRAKKLARNHSPEGRRYQREKAARRRAAQGIAYHLGTRIRAIFELNRPSARYEELLGYSMTTLRKRLVKQLRIGEFAAGVFRMMTWDDYLNGDAVIDHKIPVRMFKLPDQVKQCWALSNLQMMTWYENQRKAAKCSARRVREC